MKASANKSIQNYVFGFYLWDATCARNFLSCAKGEIDYYYFYYYYHYYSSCGSIVESLFICYLKYRFNILPFAQKTLL